MKKLFSVVVMAMMLGMSPNAISAVVILIGGGDFTADTGGTGSLGGSGADLPTDALKLTFMSNGTDKVRLSIDGTNLPTGTGKLTTLLFNLDPILVITPTFTYVSGVVADSTSFNANSFGFGTGATGFDFEFTYGPSGPLGAFKSGDTSVYDIMGAGLTENSFDFLNTGINSFKAAIHLNITGNDNSGHYGSTSVVPVPAAVWLLGSALVGLVGVFRRKRPA